MTLNLEHDVFFLPRVTRNLGSNTSGINYGVLCVTPSMLYYLPKQIVSMKRLGILTDSYSVTQLKTADIDGRPLEDVVPLLAGSLDDMEELDHALEELAAATDGSWVLPTRAIERIDIGYFAQLTLFADNQKHRFAIGGKKHRQRAQEFFSRQLGLN
jgi:hypothetical protein